LQTQVRNERIKIFPNIQPIDKPLIIDQKITDPNWLSEFSSGASAFFIAPKEGCFQVRFKKSTKSKLGVH